MRRTPKLILLILLLVCPLKLWSQDAMPVVASLDKSIDAIDSLNLSMSLGIGLYHFTKDEFIDQTVLR